MPKGIVSVDAVWVLAAVSPHVGTIDGVIAAHLLVGEAPKPSYQMLEQPAFPLSEALQLEFWMCCI